MSRRADAKYATLAATETTPTGTAGTLGSHLPTGTGSGRGSTLGASQSAAIAQHHLPPTVSAVLLLLQGKLLRRDRTFLTWKWRDFYLEQHRLQYFSEKGVRKGEIVITKNTPIMIRLLSEPKPYGFLVFIQDEKLTLAAATAQDRQKWIDVFTEVFHANVEDFQNRKTGAAVAGGSGAVVGASASGEKPEKKRTRPTFLPIPDISEDEGGPGMHYPPHHHLLGGAKTPTHPSAVTGAAGTTAAATGIRPSLTGRSSEGLLADMPAGSNAAAMAESHATSNAAGLAATAATTQAAIPPQERRVPFRRNSENLVGGEGAVPRSKFIALKEHYSSVTFPRNLGNGDVLVGVGPLVRRMGWTDERILAVGLYVDADAAAKEMHRFYGRNLKSLRGDQSFYDYLMYTSKFRRSFVVTSRKRVSKSVLVALLHDEIAPRVSGSTEALHTFLNFIEKSLRKAESMMIRIHPESGRLEFRLRGQTYPPIASSMLCQCIQSVFFDVNSIQQDAKRRLVDRFPLLWGIEESEDALVGQGTSDRDLRTHELEPKHGGNVSESEDEEDDDEDDDEGRGSTRRRGSTSADDNSQRSRILSIKEKLDEIDEREHELLRRESRSLGVHFGPIMDRDSNAVFRGDLLVDSSALLGTWSQKIMYTDDGNANDGEEADENAVERSCVVSVGLYAEPGGASETLLKYKGLSVGSILQDMDFFARFADGAFTKHLMFKVDEPIDVAKLVDYFTARVRRRGSGTGTPAGGDSGRSNDAKVRALFERLEDAQAGVLRPDDELRITIVADSKMSLSITRQLQDDGTTAFPPVDGIKIAAAPFSTIFQGIFYGYHTLDSASRSQLMERLPSLLDLAKDDLAHTYHDEIQVLKENYKRQLPEFRLKAGYLLISFEEKKMIKNADGVKEPTIMASKWSKRWCRLDGTTFSYFSHKRSKKPRDILDLTHCTVSEITSTSTLELVPFAMEKGASPSIRIGIAKRMNGEIIALRTESIYEGVEWLESLVEASRVVRELVSHHTSDEDDTDRGAIETSGGGEADESSGAHEEELDDERDDVITYDENAPLVDRSGPPSLNRSNSTVSYRAPVPYKHGSLLSWIREDTRHAVIFALLLLITWVITSHEPTVFIRSAVAPANNSAFTATTLESGGSPSN